VTSNNIPLGTANDEGDLVWLHKDQVLTSDYELVDDLNYLWQKIIADEGTFFAHSLVNEQEKIDTMSISQLPNTTQYRK